ncbi:MAG: YraN family protein [Oscillospiraceae bacterium]|nr:YraN family protein [Oscillospiraceae bacterium]
MSTRKIRGEFGENVICEHLCSNSYKIVSRNYLKKSGEIDIIAVCNESQELVFIEVKTRKFNCLVEGSNSVNYTKQNKIAKTAKIWLAENSGFSGMNVRFDVAVVSVTTDVVPQLLDIEYYENAFEPALW